MIERVSLADLARKCGVSVSSVSLALRESGNLAPATRARIKRAARQLGYRPNPLLASLASRHFHSVPNVGIPIVYLHPQERLPLYSIFPEDFRAVQDHGRRLGFQLELHHPSEFQSGAHATRVLHSRGVQGIVLSPLIHDKMLPGMDWDRFSVAGWGESMPESLGSTRLALNRANADHFNSVLRAWEQVSRRGYRRIGVALLTIRPGSTDDLQRWAAAEACLRNVPGSRRIPTFILAPDMEGDRERFGEWVKRHRPDAVIGFNAIFLSELRRYNYRVPQDIAFASLHIGQQVAAPSTPDDFAAGLVDVRIETLKAALDLLDQLIRHHQYGLPQRARLLLIEPDWVDGPTLAKRATGGAQRRALA